MIPQWYTTHCQTPITSNSLERRYVTTQRDVFFRTLGEAYKDGRDDLVIISVDMGAAALNEFKGSPFLLNIGPSEQLAVTMAAGLALKGKRPYVYGLSPFITLRALEQIRVSVCSMNLPVTIVGIGAGLSYGEAGVTHHGTEDLNIMRCLPNMTIINVSTLDMAEYYAKETFQYPEARYIRLDKFSHSIHIKTGHHTGNIFHRDNWNKRTVVSTGTLVHYLMEHLPTDIDLIEVNKFPTNKEELIISLDLDGKEIISVEEGYLIGGLGDYLSSFLPNVKKIGFHNFCKTKPREEYWQLLLNEVLNA